ncbi:MAG: peptidylprolyl isomerase [Oscillospiraceae bacterium]|nr:peptidylprolyl isomerase [Oscillospiraceae bacterium]
MGKGDRKRIQREINRIKEEERLAALKQKKKKRNIGITITAAVLAVVVGASATLIAIRQIDANNGTTLRNTISISSENVKVNNAVMTYFFNSTFNNILNYYYNMGLTDMSQLGLDVTRSLKKQTYSGTQTWFDYILSSTKTNVEEMVLLAEAAHAKNLTLDDEDKATIDENIKTMKETAEKGGMDFARYLSNNFGTGVKEEDVRSAMELSALATKYQDQFMDGLEYSDEDINKYFDENKNTYTFVDYLSYTFKADIKTGATDDEKKAAKEAAKKLADEAAKCTTKEAFEAHMKTYLKDVAKVAEDKLDAEIEKLLTEEGSYTKGDFGDWAFGKDTAINTTKVVAGTDSYTVYLLLKAPYRMEGLTKNVSHILISTSDYKAETDAKKEAERVLKLWEEGDKTLDSFKALAKEHSTDTGSASNGGVYEDVAAGDMVTEFNDWLFDEKREVGDVEIVKTTYGYHIMYFVGDSLPEWKVDLIADMENKDYTDHKTELKKAHTVTSDGGKLNEIPA